MNDIATSCVQNIIKTITKGKDAEELEEVDPDIIDQLRSAYIGGEYTVCVVLVIQTILMANNQSFKKIGIRLFNFLTKWKVELEKVDSFLWNRMASKFLIVYGPKSIRYKDIKEMILPDAKNVNDVLFKPGDYYFTASDLAHRGSQISFRGRIASMVWNMSPQEMPQIFLNTKKVACSMEQGADFGHLTHDIDNNLVFVFTQHDLSLRHASFTLKLGTGLPHSIKSYYPTIPRLDSQTDTIQNDIQVLSEAPTTRICPYTQLPVTFPVVSQTCNNSSHVFSLAPFVETIRLTQKAQCPICCIPCTITDLRVP